ncbi:conjugal transfer protein TraL [Kingella kingae]|jgi:traL protein|uniref:conjugal transfer protein TraL n=1 Tax=Kingella kingae TaxID=504 RepID=UPI00050A1636|nr:conjugal transfer protein TraL [Kingella kingae]MDK4526241.1 conjugal transfer protein TraL [Kingella kingae]MDK4532260.1 conjugal transfer protein TraL [Kingella kingae]
MKEVHFVVQGKGGVGKSFCASILAQYLQETCHDPLYCFDTDPVNPTFSRIAALKAQTVNILTEHNTINVRKFDEMIEQLVELDGIGVLDNGAATFVPLMAYLAEADLVQMLEDNGVRVVMHIPVNGGQALDDCLIGLSQTLTATRAEAVVWLNDFKGEVEENGKKFINFKAYQNFKRQILGIVHIPNRAPDTFGKDIELMTANNLTFKEAQESPDLFKLAARSRLKRVKDELFTQLSGLPIGANHADA